MKFSLNIILCMRRHINDKGNTIGFCNGHNLGLQI